MPGANQKKNPSRKPGKGRIQLQETAYSGRDASPAVIQEQPKRRVTRATAILKNAVGAAPPTSAQEEQETEDIRAVEKIVAENTQDKAVPDYVPLPNQTRTEGKPPHKEPAWKPTLDNIDQSTDFDYEPLGFAFQGPSPGVSDNEEPEKPAPDSEYLDEPSATSDDPYEEDSFSDLVARPSKKAIPAPAPPVRPAARTASTTANQKAQANDIDILIGVNGPDGLCRKLVLRSSDPFANLEHAVRIRLNDLNTPLNMSYQLTLAAKKGLRMALESQDHWDELVEAVRRHGKKKVNGQFHALLLHFMDDMPNKAAAKGKAATAAQTAAKEKVDADKKEDSELRRVIRRYECRAHGHQCWKVFNDKGVEEHYRLSSDLLSDWAFEISSGHGDINTIPDHLKERAFRNKISQKGKPAEAAPPDAKPKPRGMNGCVPATAPPSEPVPTPSESQPHPFSTGGWPGLYPGLGGLPPYMFMHPNSMAAYAMSAQAPPSPVRVKSRMEDGKTLSEWFPMLDADLEPEEEQFSTLLPALNENGVYRVRDITLFTAEEIKNYTYCSIGMAKRVLEKAQAATGRR